MYILDDESDKKLKMQQLAGYAKGLLKEISTSNHYHLSSEDYQKEITICLYDSVNISNFHPSIQKLIRDDE